MALVIANSTLDEQLGYIVPDDTGTWDQQTQWETFVEWSAQPANPLIYVLTPIDLGSVKTFNLKIKTIANGAVEYVIYTSDTGLFAGEETTTTILQNATNIAAFSGRYIIIAVKVNQTSGVNVLYGVEWSIAEGSNRLSLNDIDSSTLSGSSAARTLTLDRAIGGVTNIQITPKTVTAYNLDLYVSSTATSTTVVPRVISKTAPIQFSLVGLDNQPRDAQVDIVLEYLPEGYMDGNNLLVR